METWFYQEYKIKIYLEPENMKNIKKKYNVNLFQSDKLTETISQTDWSSSSMGLKKIMLTSMTVAQRPIQIFKGIVFSLNFVTFLKVS